MFHFLSTIALSLCLQLALCAVGLASDAVDVNQKTGTIHVYRPQSAAGLGVYFDVYADSNKVCNLKDGEYCSVKVEPGEIEVWSKFMTKGSLTLDVEAGREYFVRATVTKGFLLFWRPHYVEVLDRVGRSEIKACAPATGVLQD
ncbi:MAG: hypothetical protein FD177_2243 [Desulfovibrionaceae bacterium]|nr:MAG: hypothetical protein FD177_2243 [Desulfovibrionaceae bacterium]